MKKLDQSEIEQIINLYQQGVAPIKIANQFGIYNNSVIRILRKNGIERNQLIRVSQEETDYIIEEYGKGITSEVISDILDIDARTVCRILKRNGVEVRPTTRNAGKTKAKKAIDTDQ